MSFNTFNAIAFVLQAVSLAALVVALYSLAAMFVRWRTPQRKRHAIRLLLASTAVPCLIGIHQAMLWWVYLPSLGREQMERLNAAREARMADSTLVQVGEQAPDFTLADADGATFSLADARDQVVLINFFATWCGPCLMELPHIEQIWNDYRDLKSFRLLVVGREESMDAVRAFRTKHGYTFPVAPDPERAAYSLFATCLIPRTIVVSPDGVVVCSQAGFYDADVEQLRAVLDEQLAGRK